ncbi:hypothetical protein R2325_16360 [Mycobacteroides chelonae]|jgi:hypothetical protein|nr:MULTISPECIES: hypothetical protein [Mycobacteroides]MBV6360427.1 hypothetical protein [Mycobacteroides chelonae]MEC4857148.1 hypothetical protein [Mycobacteroides chelonae]MEC4873558.1 hypothetical protein [Mycobacteroides chelonae]SHW93523.1 Uncharacterised protein [Mycobacteroides abscessus subsp. abscessus]SKL81180.1 Uncharacterised protein [Mycobacteroides abscessus subsp. abscessus]
MWSFVTLEGVKDLIRNDVAELNHYLQLQAEDAIQAERTGRQPNYRLRTLIKAWEYAQDAHWSWYKEILEAHVHSTTAQGFEGLGFKSVGWSL